MRWLSALMLTLALGSLSPQSGFAQDDYADYNILEFVVPEGKVLRRTTKTTKTTEENGKTQTGIYTGVYDLKLQPHEDGFIVTKTRKDYLLDLGLPAPSTPEHKAVAEALADSAMPRNIVYSSDISLEPYQIENWEEFQAQLYDSLVVINAGRHDRKAFNAVYGAIGPVGNVNLFLKDDAFFSIPHNIGLHLNEPIQESAESEAAFGGTIAVLISFTLTQWSPEADRAVVEYLLTPDPESLKTYLTQVRLRQNVPDEDDAEQSEISIEMTTQCRFEVAISTGLVNKGICEVRSGISTPADVRTKTETYEIAEEWLP